MSTGGAAAIFGQGNENNDVVIREPSTVCNAHTSAGQISAVITIHQSAFTAVLSSSRTVITFQ